MKITYIGTAASEGLPALFCQCPICEAARKNGGKEIRGRAAICVNETLLIDFPPDIYYGAMRAGVNLSKVLDIVGTHAHSDHFAPTELSRQNLLNEGKNPDTIYVTGNTAIDALKTTVRENYTHPELE